MTQRARFTQAVAYTVATLAERWTCSEGVIRKLIVKGELRCFRLGTLIRIASEEVERFESQNTPSSDFAVDTPSSIETMQDEGTERDYEQPIVLGLKRKRGEDGRLGATVHHGPWG